MARDFNGTTDVIDMGDVLDLTTNVRSICAWIYPQGWGGSNSGRIINKTAASGVGNRFQINSTSGDLKFQVSSSGVTSNTTVISLNVWQHVAVSYNGANATFYVNAVSAGSPALTETGVGNTPALRIGNTSEADRGFDGYIAEVAIYNVALTADEITAAMNGRYPRIDARIGYWPLVGYSPEVDLSGAGNNGTVTGTTIVDHPPTGPMFGFDQEWQGNGLISSIVRPLKLSQTWGFR